MALPTCDCVEGLPIGEQLSAIYCALLSIAGGGDASVFLMKSANLSDVADPNAARSNIGAAASGVNSDITQITGLTTPLSVPQGGTGFNAYGHRARVQTANAGGGTFQVITSGLTTKVTVLTNEVEDANNLWDAANSQSAVLPAGGYFFTLSFAADGADWELQVFDDGVVSSYPGVVGQAGNSNKPAWSGFIQADGASIYDFRVRQFSGGDRNIYNSIDYIGLVLMRVW